MALLNLPDNLDTLTKSPAWQLSAAVLVELWGSRAIVPGLQHADVMGASSTLSLAPSRGVFSTMKWLDIEADSRALFMRRSLILANHIGYLRVLREAIAAAGSGIEGLS